MCNPSGIFRSAFKCAAFLTFMCATVYNSVLYCSFYYNFDYVQKATEVI